MGSSSGALALVVAVGASCASAGTCDREEIRRSIIASPSATYESASRECVAEDRGNRRGGTTNRAVVLHPTPEKAKLGPIATSVHNEIILCILHTPANRVPEPQKVCDEVFAEKMRTAKAQDASNARALNKRGERAKHPPVIGMTKTEALASSWGKPLKIHFTVTARGLHEQWVYRGRQYLHIDNGIVTSIQHTSIL